MNPARPAAPSPPPPLPPTPPGSLSEAFVRLGPYLKRVASRHLGPDLAGKVGASDIVQETFWVAHRKRDHLRGQSPGEVRGWLVRISLDRLAAAGRRFRGTARRRVSREVALGLPGGSTAGPYAAEPAAATTASPLSRVVLAERVEALRAALGGLPAADAQVIRWHGEERLSFAEVGTRLGITEEAARKRWARALARLEARLGPTDGSR